MRFWGLHAFNSSFQTYAEFVTDVNSGGLCEPVSFNTDIWLFFSSLPPFNRFHAVNYPQPHCLQHEFEVLSSPAPVRQVFVCGSLWRTKFSTLLWHVFVRPVRLFYLFFSSLQTCFGSDSFVGCLVWMALLKLLHSTSTVRPLTGPLQSEPFWGGFTSAFRVVDPPHRSFINGRWFRQTELPDRSPSTSTILPSQGDVLMLVSYTYWSFFPNNSTFVSPVHKTFSVVDLLFIHFTEDSALSLCLVTIF